MPTIHRRRLTKSGKVVSGVSGDCTRCDRLISSESGRLDPPHKTPATRSSFAAVSLQAAPRPITPRAQESFATASPAATVTRHDRVPNRGYRQCSPVESNHAPHHARKRVRESREGSNLSGRKSTQLAIGRCHPGRECLWRRLPVSRPPAIRPSRAVRIAIVSVKGIAAVPTLYTDRETRKARETLNFSARKSSDCSWSPCYHHATTGVLLLLSTPAISDASEGRFPASVLTPQRLRA